MDTSEHNDQVVFDSQSMDENNDLGGFGDLLDKASEHTDEKNETWNAASSIYDFTCKDIDGNDVSLEKYRGHVCLITNVATK
ncbi:hypothetical protein LSH36_28g02001 [Paralvinella palmiformis]|uniref:Uncharacterized protein n=1 Tax=Paralvinella palmiformis TaxID=53620 RepID=A0AAD9KA43_9ANNE|nr:hypothetical protein LSH36_28g02001 [Paralvinella palmiformis]